MCVYIMYIYLYIHKQYTYTYIYVKKTSPKIVNTFCSILFGLLYTIYVLQ